MRIGQRRLVLRSKLLRWGCEAGRERSCGPPHGGGVSEWSRVENAKSSERSEGTKWWPY